VCPKHKLDLSPLNHISIPTIGKVSRQLWESFFSKRLGHKVGSNIVTSKIKLDVQVGTNNIKQVNTLLLSLLDKKYM